MNPPTFQKLDFVSICEMLASHCATSLGKSLARHIEPVTSPTTVRQWLVQVRQLSEAAEEVGYPPMGGVSDIRDLVRASAFPAPLEPDQLVKVSDTLAATAPIIAWFEKAGESLAALDGLRRRMVDLSAIAAVIREAIDERSEVRDHASPRLGSIRHSIEDARRHVRIVFERILRQSGQTRMLQYSGTTFHNDRCVLPLKAEHRGRIQGIVHRSSDSGATLFVEPAESVELNNTIVRLRDEESKEITQILRGLTQRVHLNAQVILDTVRAMAVLDLVAAKCRYGKKRKCTCPEIDENGVLDLHDARHPLLVELFAAEETPLDPPLARGEGSTPLNPPLARGEGAGPSPKREVVPIDVRLGDDFDVLVITGPNTGGKTVTLKTIGLLVLMTQCGIPIPVGEGSRLPVYKDVFIDVGDEQSIQQSLSTFSSHLANLLEIIRRSGERTLVLIDELGAGTDPDEGAAIGQAIIAELLRLKAKAIVTTHLSALKAIAFTTERVDNASVEFDSVSLRPTYHLRMGEPGNSNALIIAHRLGMPNRLINLAKSSLDQRSRALTKAIAGTLDSRREAEAARKAAREAALEAKRERERYEREREEFEKSQEEFARWTAWINELRPGDEVFLRTLRRPAKVVRMQLHKQSALVSAGAMDIEVPLKDIGQPENA